MRNDRDYFRKELCFKDEESRDRFIQLYGDLFCQCKAYSELYLKFYKKVPIYSDIKYPALVCFLKTEDWNNIIRNLDVKAIRQERRTTYKVCFN